jgi:AraC-like DNA-binding protein
MFYLIGIVITFFLVALLITKKGKTKADRILVIWLIFIGLHLFFFYLYITDKGYSFPYYYLLGVHFPFPLVHGPFLFLYTATITNQLWASRYSALHAIPFFSIYLLFMPFILLPVEQKILMFKNNGQGAETLLLVLIALIMISGVVYVALSLWLLKKYKNTLQEQFSSAEKINLAWLRYLIYAIGLTWVFVLIGNDPLIFGSAVVFVFFLGYFGIKQVGIFTQQYPMEIGLGAIVQQNSRVLSEPDLIIQSSNQSANFLETPQKVKYLRSSLGEETAREIQKSLTKAINEDRLYTNPEITLAELAQTLNVHPNNLSQVINTFEGKNFYDYINHKRIEEFKRIVALPENQRFTLLALAHDCGFNSKTSFNRNFKNATGLSPSEYLKQIEVQLVTN